MLRTSGSECPGHCARAPVAHGPAFHRSRLSRPTVSLKTCFQENNPRITPSPPAGFLGHLPVQGYYLMKLACTKGRLARAAEHTWRPLLLLGQEEGPGVCCQPAADRAEQVQRARHDAAPVGRVLKWCPKFRVSDGRINNAIMALDGRRSAHRAWISPSPKRSWPVASPWFGRLPPDVVARYIRRSARRHVWLTVRAAPRALALGMWLRTTVEAFRTDSERSRGRFPETVNGPLETTAGKAQHASSKSDLARLNPREIG